MKRNLSSVDDENSDNLDVGEIYHNFENESYHVSNSNLSNQSPSELISTEEVFNTKNNESFDGESQLVNGSGEQVIRPYTVMSIAIAVITAAIAVYENGSDSDSIEVGEIYSNFPDESFEIINSNISNESLSDTFSDNLYFAGEDGKSQVAIFSNCEISEGLVTRDNVIHGYRLADGTASTVAAAAADDAADDDDVDLSASAQVNSSSSSSTSRHRSTSHSFYEFYGKIHDKYLLKIFLNKVVIAFLFYYLLTRIP